MGEVLRDQLKAHPANGPEAMAAIAALEQGHRVDTQEMHLVLQGLRDMQVREADARRLKQADPQASLVLLPNVNHVLKAITSDDRRANVATYADPALPLAAGVVDAIAQFIAGNAGNASR